MLDTAERFYTRPDRIATPIPKSRSTRLGRFAIRVERYLSRSPSAIGAAVRVRTVGGGHASAAGSDRLAHLFLSVPPDAGPHRCGIDLAPRRADRAVVRPS